MPDTQRRLDALLSPTPRWTRARAGVLAALLAAGGALLLSACRTPVPQHRNVLLILVDTLRADHLGAYAYPRPTSPTFDGLAERGTLFLQAHSTTSWTNPAIESLFTGQRPRVLQPGAPTFIAPGSRTLAAAFRAAGYRTGAIIGSPVLPPRLGFAEGFEDYVPVAGWQQGLELGPKASAQAVNAAALDWLGRTTLPGAPRPWFLYLHYMDPHWPYRPDPQSGQRFWRSSGVDLATTMGPVVQKIRSHQDLSADEQRQAVDLYDASIAHFDSALAALLDALRARGALDDTVVCLTADHGEELGDHGGYLHAHTLFEEVLRIPLLIVDPHTPVPQRVDRLTQITDIGRTVLNMAGLVDSAFPGTPLPSGASTSRDEGAVLAELMPAPLWGTVHQYALLRGHHKLLVTPGGERLLYDVQDDPSERHNLAAERADMVTQLATVLTQSATTVSPPTPAGSPATPDPALRERLRALGYDF